MIAFVNVDRLIVSLPETSLAFIETYNEAYNLASKSQVVVEALKVLEQQALALFDMFTETGRELETDKSETDNAATVETSQLAAEAFLDEAW